MNSIFDKNSECWSIMLTMKVADYISLIDDSYFSQGAIEGQRDVLRTTTAKRIRTRMVKDIENGAVIPPIVIGAVLSSNEFERVEKNQISTIKSLSDESLSDISIIDGMQRTASLIEASQNTESVLQNTIRVELWAAKNVNSLIYRMLVLNTGQVPWTLSRQLSVVYAPLIKDIEKNVPGMSRIIKPDDGGRRAAPGQYQSHNIVELYIAFSTRKTSFDTKESLSNEFSKLDFVENIPEHGEENLFYYALETLSILDHAFSEYESCEPLKFKKGRHIFDSQPARIGLLVSLGLTIIGRPGSDTERDSQLSHAREIKEKAQQLSARLSSMKNEELGNFLRLDILSEVLDKKTSQVGRFERSLFSAAFKVLIEEKFDINSMEVCWRAHDV